jgi:sulfatase-like protein
VVPLPRLNVTVRPATASMPSWLVATVHLAVLCSFAFVQPLFDLLGHNAAFFVARGNTAGDILVFAFVLVFVPPAILVAIEGLAAVISGRGRRWVHLAFVAALSGAFVLELLKRPLPDSSPVLLPVAAVAGAAFAVAYARAAGVRSVLTLLGPAPLIFLVLFLVVSPVSQLLRPEATVQAATGPPARTPVVLVIFDELPATSLMADGGRIDAERYPAFARLARESTWYRNATTVSDGTTRAVPAILTGLRPGDSSKLPTSRTYPRSLFTLLGGRWDQHVLEPVTDICPRAICPSAGGDSPGERMRSLASDLGVVSGHLLLPDDLASSLPPIDRGWADFAGIDRGLRRGLGDVRGREAPRGDWWAQRVAEAESAIAGIRPQRGRPSLLALHVVAPHVPWRYLPGGLRYLEPGPAVIPGLIPQRGWGGNRDLVLQGLQRHLLQVTFADRLVGRLVGRLKRARLWDRALVVVVADHGASFRPDEWRRPVTTTNFADIAGVPLFVKRPGQRAGQVDERPVRTIDVLPTIARTLGRGRGWRFDGAPLDRAAREAVLRVNNHNDDTTVTLPAAAFLRARDAQLAQQLRLFPPGRASLYRLGPAQHLIGRRVAALPSAPGGERGLVDRAGAYRRVDPATGVVPAFVTGRLHPREPDRLPLAVAIDGRIRATTTSWRQAGQTRFSAIVPPSSLPAGAHAVAVFAVGPGDRLRPVARTGR